jgi:hypothetical protein
MSVFVETTGFQARPRHDRQASGLLPTRFLIEPGIELANSHLGT